MFLFKVQIFSYELYPTFLHFPSLFAAGNTEVHGADACTFFLLWLREISFLSVMCHVMFLNADLFKQLILNVSLLFFFPYKNYRAVCGADNGSTSESFWSELCNYCSFMRNIYLTQLCRTMLASSLLKCGITEWSVLSDTFIKTRWFSLWYGPLYYCFPYCNMMVGNDATSFLCHRSLPRKTQSLVQIFSVATDV